MKKGALALAILLAISSSVGCFKYLNFSNIKSDPDEELVSEEVSNGQDFKLPSGDCRCRLTVETLAGQNFYIYMKDLKGDNDYSFYVEGGATVEKYVPVGEYNIFYCSGKEWYGLENKFGRHTNMLTSDRVIAFTSVSGEAGTTYWGNTLKLYPVSNGNLPTRVVSPKNFPE